MATGEPKNCITTLPKHRDRRSPHSQLQEPENHDQYSHNGRLLEDRRRGIYPPPQHEVRSSCLPDYETALGRNGRTFLWEIKEISGELQFREQGKSTDTRRLHH